MYVDMPSEVVSLSAMTKWLRTPSADFTIQFFLFLPFLSKLLLLHYFFYYYFIIIVHLVLCTLLTGA